MLQLGKAMTALSALRKARATVECANTLAWTPCLDGCLAEWDENPAQGHSFAECTASAYLDGLSVVAVTRAEEALEREARRGR